MKRAFSLATAILLFGSLFSIRTIAASADPAGTECLSGNTIYFLNSSHQKQPYTSSGAFLSYSYDSWSKVIPCSSEDLALPTGAFVPPADGSLINDHGTVYLITNGQRAGFTSASVFTGLGYSWSNVIPGDTSFMTNASLISTTSMAHPAGTLVNQSGTVYLVTKTGKTGIPSEDVLSGWGYSLKEIVASNNYDDSLAASGILNQRPSGEYEPEQNISGNGGSSQGSTSPSPSASVTPTNQNISYSDWLNKYFPNCTDQSICGDNADPDKDGLTNKQEYSYGTDPTNPSTAGDGIADGDKVNVFNLDPLSSHTAGSATYTDTQDLQEKYNSKLGHYFTDAELQAIRTNAQKYGLHQPTIDTLNKLDSNLVDFYTGSQSISVDLTNPTDSSSVSGTINLTANVTGLYNLSYVQFMIDGSAFGAKLTQSPYSLPFNTNIFANGEHQASVEAVDANNNKYVSKNVSFTIGNFQIINDGKSQNQDTTPPTISITNPANSGVVSGTINISASASDNVAVASVQFKIDGSNLGSAVIAAPYSYSLNTTTLSNGNHTLTAVAIDTSGNTATASTITFNVSNTIPDTTPPTASITYPNNSSTVSGIVTIDVSASDNIAVANVQLQLDGANIGSALTAAPYTYSWDTTSLAAGNHTLTAIATDTSGNKTTSAAVTVNVSNVLGSAISSCGTISAAGNYYLTQDLTSIGTCISVQADNVTLNLNGHTITYGTCTDGSCFKTIGNITSLTQDTNGVVTVTIDQPNTNLLTNQVQLANVGNSVFDNNYQVDSIISSTQFTVRGPSYTSISTSGGQAIVPYKRHAILAIACWDTTVDGNPCGGTANNLTIYNGTITQSSAVGPRSAAIRFGQGAGAGLVVHNVTFNVVGNSVRAVETNYGSGTQVYSNTIHDNSTVIIDRQIMDGAVIYLSDTSGNPDDVYNNTIIGSPQGGIYTVEPSSLVYGNNISMTSNSTNDFCIYPYANNIQVYNNTCDNSNGSGRGIHINNPNGTLSGVIVHDNIIKTKVLANDAEYGGCELGGAYGIQLEGPDNNISVYNNTVTAIADQCDAAALRATSDGNTTLGTNNNVYNNTFIAQRVGTTTHLANGFTSSSAEGGLVIHDNTFTTDSAAIYAPYDGFSNIVWQNNTFAEGANLDPNGWYLISFANSGVSTGNIIQDPSFTSPASDYSVGRIQGQDGWEGPEEFFYQWTTTIKVVNSSGTPISGATVNIKDSLGNSELTNGTTDANGQVTAELVQYRKYNTTTAALTQENRNPHTVTVSATGYTTQTVSVTATSKQIITVTMAP